MNDDPSECPPPNRRVPSIQRAMAAMAKRTYATQAPGFRLYLGGCYVWIYKHARMSGWSALYIFGFHEVLALLTTQSTGGY